VALIPTQVSEEACRSALTRNHSPDIPFDLSLNPYRGCEHGCSYCYARPTHSALGWSPGLDFETRLVARTNMAIVLARELRSRAYRPGLVCLGTVTDAYQPVERSMGISRQLISVLAKARHPLAIITKGSGIERDIDLLAPMAMQGLAVVYVTVTTLDRHLARLMEPRAPTPARRIETIRRLTEAGIPVGVSVAPQIPFLNTDMEAVLDAAAAAGARQAFYTVLRLPGEVEPVFTDWLRQHFPDRAERVLARVRDVRGGVLYDPRFGLRMTGQGIWADVLRQRFTQACRRLGLNAERMATDLTQFAPHRLDDQVDLFDAV
jgi:DNA repair photolyase